MTPLNASKVRVPKMAEMVAAQLRSKIIRGELPAGSSLPIEAKLTEQFSISRPTLREALRILETESLIRIQRGMRGGAVVQVPDSDVAAQVAGLLLQSRGTSIRDVFDARSTIEPPLAGLVAAKATDDDLHVVREALRLEEEAVDVVELTRQQTRFHLTVAELSGNNTLSMVCTMLHHIVERATVDRVHVSVGTPEQEQGTADGTKAHRKLVDLIEAGDSEGAVELWKRHIHGMSEFILAGIPSSTVLDLLD